MFTTRPEIQGTFGVVASTHWIATAVGMRALELGGNAYDAAASAGFVLQVVEPHLNGPAGDMPAIVRPAGGPVRVLCGQGVAPAGATIAHYRGQGLDLVPGSGLLATVVPGAFDAWMLLLLEHGSLPLAEVLAPAIHYARHGHPILPRVVAEIEKLAAFFGEHWPTSAATWLVNGAAPVAGSLFRNPVLADTYGRISDEAAAAGSRERGIEAARRAWREGFVAGAVDDYLRVAEVMDASGARRRGVLTGADMAAWQASWEAPVSVEHAGWRVHKPGFWSQGPVQLQALKLLQGLDIGAMDPAGPEFVHAVAEALKLAFADRETYYGDGAPVPGKALLSEAYAASRRGLIGERASFDLRPGTVPGFEAQVARGLPAAAGQGSGSGLGIGEPTMAHLAQRAPPHPSARRGDTVHVDAIDRWGNAVSVTPSGGWLQASPVVPGLGFALNSRAQMYWLEEGRPASLVPGTRPRTTLSPSLAVHEDGRVLSYGTPGGDQQDQWQLAFFLRRAHHGLNLQACIDLPLFHSAHAPSSFYPRGARPGHLLVEEAIGEAAIRALRARGHDLEVAPAWSAGRLTAAASGPDGVLRAAATPRLMQAYAAGR